MAPKLADILKRPAARRRMRELLRKRPASKPKYLGTLSVQFPAKEVQEYWPLAGCPKYVVVRLPTHKQVSAWRGFYGIEYAFRKLQKQQVTRRDRPPFGVCLALQKEQNGGNHERCDLAVRFSAITGARAEHGYYHRLLALSLTMCHWNVHGQLLAVPYQVPAGSLDSYEVHHLRGWHRASLKFLAVVPIALHKKLSTGEIKRLPMPAGGIRMVPAISVG